MLSVVRQMHSNALRSTGNNFFHFANKKPEEMIANVITLATLATPSVLAFGFGFFAGQTHPKKTHLDENKLNDHPFSPPVKHFSNF